MSDNNETPVTEEGQGTPVSSGVFEPIKAMSALERVQLHSSGRAYFRDIYPLKCTGDWPPSKAKKVVEMQGGECVRYHGQLYAVMNTAIVEADIAALIEERTDAVS